MANPQIFVAYPYSFSKADYRRVFRDVGKTYAVTFTYADEKITNKQILEKIETMIEEAEFSIFDITTWNPNVALELGIARGQGVDYYILFNPSNRARRGSCGPWRYRSSSVHRLRRTGD